MHTFENAGQVQPLHTDAGSNYVFRHPVNDQNLVYCRRAIVCDRKTLAYAPAVQLPDEESCTRVFPTQVTGSTIYVETASLTNGCRW